VICYYCFFVFFYINLMNFLNIDQKRVVQNDRGHIFCPRFFQKAPLSRSFHSKRYFSEYFFGKTRLEGQTRVSSTPRQLFFKHISVVTSTLVSVIGRCTRLCFADRPRIRQSRWTRIDQVSRHVFPPDVSSSFRSRSSRGFFPKPMF